jgi:hypothetical protein
MFLFQSWMTCEQFVTTTTFASHYQTKKVRNKTPKTQNKCYI